MSGITTRMIYAKEPTKNTREVPDHHVEHVSETVKLMKPRIRPAGRRGGRRTLHGFAVGNQWVEGGITVELVPESIGELLELCMGTNVTAGAGPYTHTLTPGALETFTVQFIREDEAGTSNVFEYTGCMVKSWTIAWDASGDGSMVTLTLDIAGFDETTNQSAVAESYPTLTARWTSVQSSLTTAAAAYPVNSFTLTGNNNVRVNHQSQATNPGKPDITDPGVREYTGTLSADFESLTQYARYTAATESALVVTISDGTYSLVITTNVMYTGETPTDSGDDVIGESSPFECLSATTDAAAITMVLTNGDSAA